MIISTKVIYGNLDYKPIVENLSMAYSCDPFKITLGLLTSNKEVLGNNYKVLPPGATSNEHIKQGQFLEKKKVLSEFQSVNKRIREEDNVTSDNYYDNILNECVIDAANELIEQER